MWISTADESADDGSIYRDDNNPMEDIDDADGSADDGNIYQDDNNPMEDIDDAPDQDLTRIRHKNTITTSNGTNHRTNKIEFVTPNPPVDYSSIQDSALKGKLNLPNDFPLDPKSFDYYKLYMTDFMVHQLKQTINKNIWDAKHAEQQHLNSLSSTDPASFLMEEDEQKTVPQVTFGDVRCFLGIQL